ncbi:MAG: hypothetical protein K5657_07515, partial [Desulfovibrio sp.]|nr:hypothetical protein [Desulfovibrio sp.]
MPEINTNLRCLFFQNAHIMPFEKNGYAVYTHDGQLIKESLNFRDYCLVFRPREFTTPKIRLTEDCIFGGFLFKHYGHFLLESLSRLWFAKEHPNLLVVFVCRDT